MAMENPHFYEWAPMVGQRVCVLGQGASVCEVTSVDFKTRTFEAVAVGAGLPLKQYPRGAITGGEIKPQARASGKP
jgi:hypothetical protein